MRLNLRQFNRVIIGSLEGKINELKKDLVMQKYKA